MNELTFEKWIAMLTKACKKMLALERNSEAYRFLLDEGLLQYRLDCLPVDSEQFVARYLRCKPGVQARGNHFSEIAAIVSENLKLRLEDVKSVLKEHPEMGTVNWTSIGEQLLLAFKPLVQEWMQQERFLSSELCRQIVYLQLNVEKKDSDAVLTDVLAITELALAVSWNPEKLFQPAKTEAILDLDSAVYFLFWFEQGLRHTEALLPLFDKALALYKRYEPQIIQPLQNLYRLAGCDRKPNALYGTELLLLRAEYWMNREDANFVSQAIRQYQLIEMGYCQGIAGYILLCRSARLYGYKRLITLIDSGFSAMETKEQILEDAKADCSSPLPSGHLTAKEREAYMQITAHMREWIQTQEI